MTLCLGVLFSVLRLGIAMRKQRLAERPRDPSLMRRHLRLAKPVVVFAMLGFLGGALSASRLRGWALFETFHALVGLVVVSLLGATAWLGRRAERAAGSPGLHGLLGVLFTLAACLAAIAGFVLLP